MDREKLREKLKSDFVEALRKRKDILVRDVASATSDTDLLTSTCLELAAVTCLIDSMEANAYNPFLDYHLKRADGYTVYEVGDTEIDIIASDMDAFVFRAADAMVSRMRWCAGDTLAPSTINYELISVMDKVLHDKG